MALRMMTFLLLCCSGMTSMALPGEGGRLLPGDLVYKGAFRLPASGSEEYAWKWSGQALAFRLQGTRTREAGHLPGSLFGSGHNWHQWVSEVTIPEPILSEGKALTDLPVARTLRPFRDLMGDLYAARDMEQPRMGLVVHPASDPDSPWLLFSRAPHLLEKEGNPCFGMIQMDTDATRSIGLYAVGKFGEYQTVDYLVTPPPIWAEHHTPGKTVLCGRFRDGGQASQGPTLIAFAPPDLDTPPTPGTRLEATALLRYSNVMDDDPSHTLLDYRHSDDWAGAAWLESHGRATVLIIGTKGIGRTWYGFANGVVWPDNPPYPDVPAYPHDQRGWWSESFRPRMLFFDPAELARVAAGEMAPHIPQPYAILDFEDKLFRPISDRGREMRYIGACADDPQTATLYVMELLVDEDRPIIHVWQVRGSAR